MPTKVTGADERAPKVLVTPDNEEYLREIGASIGISMGMPMGEAACILGGLIMQLEARVAELERQCL